VFAIALESGRARLENQLHDSALPRKPSFCDQVMCHPPLAMHSRPPVRRLTGHPPGLHPPPARHAVPENESCPFPIHYRVNTRKYKIIPVMLQRHQPPSPVGVALHDEITPPHSDGLTTHHCVSNFYTHPHVLLFPTCTCVRTLAVDGMVLPHHLVRRSALQRLIVIQGPNLLPPRPTCPYPRGAIPPITHQPFAGDTDRFDGIRTMSTGFFEASRNDGAR